jgi:hypothetical protein
LRFDNGGPWGSDGDWPPDLALWLIGLGVDVHYNDPRAPTQNAVVERSQGTSKRWGEPQTCASAQELQKRLRRFDSIQRAVYPSLPDRAVSRPSPGCRIRVGLTRGSGKTSIGIIGVC